MSDEPKLEYEECAYITRGPDYLFPKYAGSINMNLGNGIFCQELETKPSAWKLFWLRFFFGVTWEDSDE